MFFLYRHTVVSVGVWLGGSGHVYDLCHSVWRSYPRKYLQISILWYIMYRQPVLKLRWFFDDLTTTCIRIFT